MHFNTCNLLRMLTLRRVSPTLAALALLVLAATVLAPATALPSLGGLHALLLGYVLLVGAIVARYSATNLRGQPHQQRFAILLLAAVLSLAVMVGTEVLLVSAVGATLSGWMLVGLVGHRHDAPARRAAQVVRRHLLLGDLALWSAVLVHLLDGPGALVAVGIVVACVARTALVPAHRWLPETSEAPSPVSALLHGGVVNGGLMLVLVHWDLVAAQTSALVVLGVAGLASVALGLAQARLRPDVKGRLASSTTSQMGLGAVALSLGLPQVALIHLLGHGLWKAWLFLRAGGAVARSRASAPLPLSPEDPARPTAALSAAVLAVTAGAGVLGLGLLLGRALDLPGGLALPAVVAAALAGAAVLEALRLERTTGLLRLGLATAGPLLVVGYLLLVVLADRATHVWFSAGEVTAPAVLGLAAGAIVLALALGSARLKTGSTSTLAGLVAPTLLPPGALPAAHLRSLPADDPSHGQRDGQCGEPTSVPDVRAVAEVAAGSVSTAWPLASLVAVNPLADLERFPVEDAAAMVADLHGRDPRPSLGLFLDLHARGVISRAALATAMAETPGRLQGHDLDTFLAVSRDGAARAAGAALRVRACDASAARPGRLAPGEVLDLQAASWTARAWSTDSGLDPWTLWHTSVTSPTHGLVWRQRGVSAWAQSLPTQAQAAVPVLWQQLRGRLGGVDLLSYAAALLTAAPGWTGHAKWRATHGGEPGALVSLLALRMALDLVLSDAAGDRGRDAAPGPGSSPEGRLARDAVGVWQRALDLSARDGLVNALAQPAQPAAQPAPPRPTPLRARPSVQSVWCIDVRSERVRRAAEHTAGHETFGYAGFFGAPVRHVDLDGCTGDLCPGLLSPALDVHEAPRSLRLGEALHRWVTRVGRQPVASFGYAEVNGLPALTATLAATWDGARWRRLSRALTGADPARVEPGEGLPHEVAVEVAAGLLTATGLAEDAGEVVVLVGHASSTENNAFAAAYDCGACGGHRGALNAQLVAEALNDPAVRAALAARGLALPADTVVVAAQHDTTADRVVPVHRAGTHLTATALRAVSELDEAAGRAAAEREVLLPGRSPRHTLAQRAADWSEPMPEWGLAGNLALVVGPRGLTAGLDLGGTAFLHSYEPALDPDGSVLAAVMAGPVVVTQWINAQYYASTSAPHLLGSGDKTTHNVVGGVGVITGAHGDLRTGLPWQAVADHDPGADAADSSVLRHLPARHLVVVAAPRDRVHAVVQGHAGLRDAVAHGWLQLLVVEDASTEGRRTLVELGRDLHWRGVVPQHPSRVRVG